MLKHIFILLSLVLAGCADTPPRLRVMTYNIHHGADSEELPTLERVAELIEREEVDVVALQEVDRAWSARSGFRDQVEVLANRLNMNAYFGAIYDLEPDSSTLSHTPASRTDSLVRGSDDTTAASAERLRYGLAILSRFSIVDSTNYELIRLFSGKSHPESRTLPGFPRVAIEVDGVTLDIFNTHLDYRSDPELRRLQVAEMLEILEPFGGPAILMGDFNALPEADELEPLHDRFVDAWAIDGQGEGLTYPATTPERRIDAIFITQTIRVDTIYVPSSTASDHRPVVADLTLQH